MRFALGRREVAHEQVVARRSEDDAAWHVRRVLSALGHNRAEGGPRRSVSNASISPDRCVFTFWLTTNRRSPSMTIPFGPSRPVGENPASSVPVSRHRTA